MHLVRKWPETEVTRRPRFGREQVKSGHNSDIAELTGPRQTDILRAALVDGDRMQFDQSTRRKLITLLGGAAVSWPLRARAQQPERMRRIGVLMGWPESDLEAQAQIAAFRDGLQKLGWMEAAISYRNSLGDTYRRGGDATVRKGISRATARRHSCEHHTHHDRTAATNALHPHRFRDRRRSDRKRLRHEFCLGRVATSPVSPLSRSR